MDDTKTAKFTSLENLYEYSNLCIICKSSSNVRVFIIDYTSFILKITNHINYYSITITYMHIYVCFLYTYKMQYVCMCLLLLCTYVCINIHCKLHIGDNRLIGTSKIHSCNKENMYVSGKF